jgi:hypothetical protein
MPFRIRVLILALSSLASGFLALFLIFFFVLSAPEPSYGILSVDASWPDRLVGERLAGLGGYISESTQWVFLDDFGELSRVPLDEFPGRLESFDPRNDGYALKLASLFVREGRRRFFIPLGGASPGDLRGFAGKLRRALEGIPYAFQAPEGEGPRLWYLLLGALALGGAFALASRSPAWGALFPLLAPAALLGPPGFALAGFLAAFFSLLREPLGEWFSLRRYWNIGLKKILRVYRKGGEGYPAALPRLPWGAALGLLILYGGLCYWGEIYPLLGMVFLLLFFFLLPLGLWLEANRGGEHIRFAPLVIVDPPSPAPPFSRLVLPFALASALALRPLPLPGTGFLGEAPKLPAEAFSLSPEDYERHAAFQAGFSRSSPAVDPLNQTGYLRYYLGEDGLIAGSRPQEGPSGGDKVEIPPFPLGELVAFLSGEALEPAPGGSRFRDVVPVCLLLGAGLPSLFGPGSGGYKKLKPRMAHSKRVAA